MIKDLIRRIKIKIKVLKVNNALNVKLTQDQIDYIFNGKKYKKTERKTGKTLAYILKILLNDGVYNINNIKPDEKRTNHEYKIIFMECFKSIYFKLKNKRVIKCTIEGLYDEKSVKKQREN